MNSTSRSSRQGASPLKGEALWQEAARPDADNLGLARSIRWQADRRIGAQRPGSPRVPRPVRPGRHPPPSSMPSPSRSSRLCPASLDSQSVAYRRHDLARRLRQGPGRRLSRRPRCRPIPRSIAFSSPIPSSARSSGNSKRNRQMRPGWPSLPRKGFPIDPRSPTGFASEVWSKPRVELPRCDNPRSMSSPGAFREQGEEDRARRLIQAWLADRRKNRLSASDAEGRILLAGSYDKMLGDRSTAGELLKEALAIDPQSKSGRRRVLAVGVSQRGRRLVRPQSGENEPNWNR